MKPTCILPQLCSFQIKTSQLPLYPLINSLKKAYAFAGVFSGTFSPFQLIRSETTWVELTSIYSVDSFSFDTHTSATFKALMDSYKTYDDDVLIKIAELVKQVMCMYYYGKR
ncbi:hypothetical protein Hanom_Chr05g00464981 [Helianthus anomalus]